MPAKSTCSIDDLRAAHPDLGFGLYALEPHGPVTLQVHTPEGDVFSFRALTAQAAIDHAFPPAATSVASETQPTPIDIFE